MIEIYVEPTGLDAARAYVARAYLGKDLVAGVVFSYGSDKDDARDRLIAKLKSWAKEQIK
jgi:hypothetical protein